MSNLVKKITSAVAGIAIVFSIVAPISGVNAATSSLEAANKLATLGVIVDQSANPADYRLGDTISRKEMAKVTINLSSLSVTNNCVSSFADLSSSDWGCKYAEAGLAAGYFAANTNFRPNANISKWEALKFIMKATGIEKGSDADFRKAYVDAAVEAGISDAFSDYDTSAKRGLIFNWAAEAVSDEGEDDLLGDLLGGLDGEDTTDDTTDETTTVVSGDAVLTVSLSPETVDAATIPGAVSGLPAATFDFTAGSEDVTINSLTIKRRGLSDRDTLSSIAAISSDGRISKGKNDSQENNTEAQLNLTNGVVVKAGETKAITIVVDVQGVAKTAQDEFALELVEVVASSTVVEEGSLVGNTLRVGSVDASKITIETDGSVSDPKLGEEGAKMFRFKVRGNNEEDTVLKSITFKANSRNAEDNLSNFELINDGNVVATATSVNNKYLTFNLGEGLTIAEGRTEKFIVTADVIAGASETVSFKIDKKLDVTGIGTRYGYGLSVNISAVDGDTSDNVNELGSITIEAGELTLIDIDAPSNKIRQDKRDVVLGQIRVTNVAGKNLELQKFGVKVELSDFDDGTLETIFENFELYNSETGTSYDLTLTKESGGTVGTYSDEDLNVNIPQGTINFIIRADTKEDLHAETKVNLSLAAGGNSNTGLFKVVETVDDKEVTDLTPSSLTWKKLEIIESIATISKQPLANTKVVRGAKNEVVIQFEIEAGEASSITIDEVRVKLSKVLSGATDKTSATNQEISQVSLYRGTISDSNLLDRVSGSSLADGLATFEGFKVQIVADDRQTFLVTADIVDGDSPVTNSPISASLEFVSAEDDESDDVTVKNGTADLSAAAPLSGGKDVSVTNVGEITFQEDPNNEDNEEAKTILGGESAVVFSADIQATNESIDVETVEFKVNKILGSSVVNASLYLGTTLVATNSNSDITEYSGTGGTGSIIKFKNLTTLILPEESRELKLKLNTATIGFQKVGITVESVKVISIELSDAEGVDSGKDVTDLNGEDIASLTIMGAKTFSIAPALITPSVVSTFGTEAKIKFTVSAGGNTATGSNSNVLTKLTELRFSTVGSTYIGSFDLYVEGNSSLVANATGSGNVLTFDSDNLNRTFGDGIISSSRTFILVPKDGISDRTVSVKLLKDGVTYNVMNVDPSTDLKTNLTSELDLGSIIR